MMHPNKLKLFNNESKKSVWESQLGRMKSGYINGTIKKIVEDSINEITSAHQEIYDDLFLSNNFKNYFYCRYLGLYLSNEEYFNKIQSLDIPDGVYDYFMASNSRVNSNDLGWCKKTSPFMYMFDGKLCIIPKNDLEAMEEVKKMQKIIKISFIEDLAKKDPDQHLLDLMKFHQDKDLKVDINKEFIKDLNYIKTLDKMIPPIITKIQSSGPLNNSINEEINFSVYSKL